MSKQGDKAIQARTSCPISNPFNGGILEYYVPMRVAFQKVHEHVRPYHDGASVEWLTAKLGRRSFLWDGSRRFHVWERDSYRVFAAPEYGMSVEYFIPNSSGDGEDLKIIAAHRAAARKAIDDFIRDVGLTDEVRGPDREVFAMPESIAKDMAIKLRAAIRAHRDAKTSAGTVGPEDEALWESLFIRGPFGSWVHGAEGSGPEADEARPVPARGGDDQ